MLVFDELTREGLIPLLPRIADDWLDLVDIPSRRGLYAYQPGQPPTVSMTAVRTPTKVSLRLPTSATILLSIRRSDSQQAHAQGMEFCWISKTRLIRSV